MATPTRTQPLIPPDERFWKRYSPHYELPLAGTASLFLHGILFGLLLFGGLWKLLQWRSEQSRPPSMDVVMLEGGGDGSEGAAGLPGLPGDLGTEVAAQDQPMTPELAKKFAALELDQVPRIDLEVPEVPLPEPKEDISKLLDDISKEVDKLPKEKTKTVAPRPKDGVASGKGSGTTAKGPVGQGGTGGGLGKGTKGTGFGSGGPGGRKLTRAEIFARRWRFDLSGTGKEHADKIAAVGLILVIPSPQGELLFIKDIRRRPVELQPGNLGKFQDAVKWQNTSPHSIQALARELQLPFVPPAVFMFLPREREEKMAAEELRFAQQAGRPPALVQETWFDFRLRGGQYEPVAIAQK